MRILHLSDLHLTHRFATLDEALSAPAHLLQKDSFDFVVVSGDLSQKSARKEYEQLKKFLKHTVIRLLRVKDLTRIILVPGNHDIDWTAEIGKYLSLGQELDSNPKFSNRLREAIRNPAESNLRWWLSNDGHLSVLEIEPDRYHLRFRNVQAFFEGFYNSKEVRPSNLFRRFQFGKDDASHWSAHIFPKEGIAFFGFSSCHKNDRYWSGAKFSPKAIHQARRYAEKHASGCIWIAVWHHGLDSGSGRPDRLSPTDIGLLHDAGFRIGFHGHTHQAAYEPADTLFDNGFFIVSTGSLGADALDRPDSIGNQFSIAQVYQGHIDVEVFTRQGKSATYKSRGERRRFLLKKPYTPLLDQFSHAAKHKRTWTVSRNGTAKVVVELEKIHRRGALTLALIEQPFCNVIGRKTAESSAGGIPVERQELSDGRIRFVLEQGEPNEEPLESIRWSYLISNCLALTQADLVAREKPSPALDGLPAEESAGLDGCPHTVRFLCDELQLVVVLDPSILIDNGSTSSTAFTRTEERGQVVWKVDPDEEKRIEQFKTKSRMGIVIPSPLVGHRYLVTYKPASKGPQYPPEAITFLEWLIDQCLNKLPAESMLPSLLTRSISAGLQQVLGPWAGHSSVWVGHLWHPRQHILKTAFGMIPNREWSINFSWGAGIAGHALRFADAASWFKNDMSQGSLIYRPRSGDSSDEDYSWIVCTPISLSPKGPALGVIGLAGNNQGGAAEASLREYAQITAECKIPQTQAKLPDSITELNDRLFGTVNTAFWQTLLSSTNPKLTNAVRTWVQKVAEAHKLPHLVEESPTSPIASK